MLSRFAFGATLHALRSNDLLTAVAAPAVIRSSAAPVLNYLRKTVEF
jgi:hypothetical protein